MVPDVDPKGPKTSFGPFWALVKNLLGPLWAVLGPISTGNPQGPMRPTGTHVMGNMQPMGPMEPMEPMEPMGPVGDPCARAGPWGPWDPR